MHEGWFHRGCLEVGYFILVAVLYTNRCTVNDSRVFCLIHALIAMYVSLQKVKGYFNQPGGHLTFISQWNLTNCLYNYTSNRNVYVGMTVANKVRKQVWK